MEIENFSDLIISVFGFKENMYATNTWPMTKNLLLNCLIDFELLEEVN
jgi:hypothetical protein